MTEDYLRLKEAIAGQSALISSIIESLDEEQWYRPSKLEGWNVFALVAHILRAPKALVEYAAEPLQVAPKYDRMNYYTFDGPAIAEAVSQRALDIAAHTTPQALTQEFADTVQAALAVFDRVPASTVINSIFGPITAGEYAATRVLELTVHTLDLTLALDMPPRLDPQAQQIVVEILENLLKPQSRPAELSDDVAFILAATGRERRPDVFIKAFS